jgi:tRNA A-37 threonylcarbamoyl transferase component Bud32
MGAKPQGYVQLRIAGRARREHSTASDLTCLCLEDLAGELRAIYDRHAWVYEHFAASSDAASLRGRRPVLTGSLGGRPAVIKRLFHGGWAAGLLKDRFLSSERVMNHLPVSRFLSDQGIATPQVLFASWRRIFGTVRGEVGFEHVEGIDADRWFFRKGVVPVEWPDRAREVGDLVAKLHSVDFHHRDMNLMNFYFARDGRTLILDLDKSSLDGPMGDAEKKATLARLERSIRKQGRESDPDYVAGIIAEVRAGYAEADA